MSSRESAPPLPLFARDVRALLSRWHLWAALAVVGIVQAAALHSAAPLEGALPALLGALVAAWLCALPVVLACGAANDQGANAALLIQLGHGPARLTLAKASAGVVGAMVLALPTAIAGGLLAARGATVTVGAASLLLLLLAAALMGALALWLAALVESSGWAALVTLLGTLGALWLDGSNGFLDVLRLARSGEVPLATLGVLVVAALTLLTLAAILGSPVASGERRVVRSLIALALGSALGAAASRIPGNLGATMLLEARARAAQATVLGELRGVSLALGAGFLLVGLWMVWRRRP